VTIRSRKGDCVLILRRSIVITDAKFWHPQVSTSAASCARCGLCSREVR